MIIKSFGTCCTAKILEDVYGYDKEEQGYEIYVRNRELLCDTYEKYKNLYAIPELVRVLKAHEKQESEFRPVIGGYKGNLENLALLFLTVNGYQNWARKFFKEVGFRSTKSTPKGAHKERDLYGMFGDGVTLQAWLDENRNK